MPKSIDLDLKSDAVYKHGTSSRVSSVWAFEGDSVTLHNCLSSAVTVDITTGASASSALFGSSSYDVAAGKATALLTVVLTTTNGVGASANPTYALSYRFGSSTVSVQMYVNTVRLSQSSQDKPVSGATVLQNANIYFDTSAQNAEALNISSPELFGQTQLTLANGMSSAYPVRAPKGSFTLKDKGPTGTSGDTITIKVDTGGAGSGGVEL